MSDDRYKIPLTQASSMTAPSGTHRAVRRVDGPLGQGELVSGRYRIMRAMGSGGMGVVYEAFDLELEERVALKLLWPELGATKRARKQLRGEVRLARRVSHPNVCRVHDIGTHEEQLYVTMELLQGESLRALLHAGLSEMTLAKRVDLLGQMCSGLAAAHRAGVVHRDVKPDNAIVERDRVVLTDFGIAGVRETQALPTEISGTPSYMAPEVLRAEACDERVDVYALGLLAFELLSGHRAFRHESLAAAIIQAREGYPIPSLPRAGIPSRLYPALSAVLMRSLAPDPANRTRSASRFARELADAARGGEESLPGVTSGAWAGAQPVLSEVSRSVSTSSASVSRAQLRVATALTFMLRDASIETWEGYGIQTPQGLDSLSSGSWPAPAFTERFERVIMDLGGTPIAVREDYLVALFGAPVAHGDDVIRAVRAAFALSELTQGEGRVGIDTARVLVRVTPQGIAASGDALKRSDALARGASPGEVLASHATARHLQGRFRSELASGAHAVGIERIYRVYSEREEAGFVGERPPLVGRDRELLWIEERVMSVCAQRAPVHISILAEGGFGKSRLRLEVVARLEQKREIDWLIARSTPLGEATPLGLLESANAHWFEVATRPEFGNQAARFAAARLWLEKRATQRPVVLILEDIHWADDASLDFIEVLSSSLDALPITILSFARPSLLLRRPEWRARITQTSNTGYILELGALDSESALEVARHHAPGLSRSALREIAERAGGQPFFIEELARDAQEREWSGVAVSSTHLPSSVEAVLQARLDRLAPEERRVLCEAAVIGRTFERDTLIAALFASSDEIDPWKVDSWLAELERRALLFPLPPERLNDERYAFKHALVRDVAYAQLAPRDRRRIHAAVARCLRTKVSASGEHHAMIFDLAQHLDAAGDRSGASEAFARAGKRAVDLFAYEEARHAIERALALTDTAEPELLERYGDVLTVVASASESLEQYQKALADPSQFSATMAARLHRKMGRSIQSSGDNQRALEWYGAGLELLAPGGVLTAEATADPREAAALYGVLGWVQGYLMGDNITGLPNSEANVRLLEGTEHQRDLAHAFSRLGANYMRAGRWRDQLWCNQRNLEIGENLSDLNLQCTAHINLGVVYASLGELPLAVEHTQYALKLAVHTGSLSTAALARSNLAGLHLDLEQGDLAGLESELHEAIRVGDKVGFCGFIPESLTFLARVKALRGDLESAEALAREAVGRAELYESHIDVGITQRILGSILGLRGKDGAAEASFLESFRLLEHADPFEYARTQAARARFLEARGVNPAEFERLKAAARTTFEALGARYDLELLEQPGTHITK